MPSKWSILKEQEYMKKTCVLLAIILLGIFVTFACELPTSLKFKSDDFKMNAPVKIGRFNIATVLSETVKGAFPDSFEVYDMFNYPNLQVFLVGYETVLMESFNPDDYLDDIRRQMRKMDQLKSDADVKPSIVIPSMTTKPLEDEKWRFFDMKGFFQDMQDQINLTSNPEKSAPMSYVQSTSPETVSLPSELQNLPPFMVFKHGNPNDPNFDSVFVDKGKIVLNIWLENVSPSTIRLELDGIELRESEPGYDYIGTPQSSQTAILDSSNTRNNPQKITINIDGKEIKKDNPPQFHLGNITSYYGNLAPNVSYTLFVQPQIESITLRGARALRIGRSEEDIPDDIIENIETEPDKNMINAEIAVGELWMVQETPRADPSNRTHCEGMNIGYRVVFHQDAVSIPGFSSFGGLTDTFTMEDPSQPNPSLGGKLINGNPLTVDTFASKIIITIADPNIGATFELFDDLIYAPDHPLTDKVLPLKIDMGMNIDELAVVRWRMNDKDDGSPLLPIDVPPIDFSGGDGEDPVIRSITFSEMKLDVNFTEMPEELKGNIALQVDSPDLGFYKSPPTNPRKLEQDENEFIGTPKKLYVNQEHHQAPIDVKILPVVNGDIKAEDFPYMEFGPVNMKDENDDYLEEIDLSINAQVKMSYAWTEAEVNMHAALKNSDRDDPLGIVPENLEEAVDLSVLGKYMHGITFGDGIQAKVFLGGPRKLLEAIQPKIDFYAQWENENMETQEEPLLIQHEFKITEALPKLPGKDFRGEFVYSGLELPEPDLGMILTNSFNEIFTAFPRNLRFRYEMILPNADNPLTVYPETFGEDVEEDAGRMKGLLVILLPMEFIAEPGGYLALPDLFEEGKDIFGRKTPEASSLFTGVHINKLSIKMNFGYSFLSGSNLHFDRDDILFGEDGFPLGGGNSLKVTFTGVQQSIINENLIYPDIKFVFPEERILQIGRYSLPIKVVIDASGSYTVDLDDLGLGN